MDSGNVIPHHLIMKKTIFVTDSAQWAAMMLEKIRAMNKMEYNQGDFFCFEIVSNDVWATTTDRRKGSVPLRQCLFFDNPTSTRHNSSLPLPAPLR